MTRLIFAPVVRTELLEIGTFIAADNLERAASFVQELEDKARSIVRFPRMYRVREEIAPDVRLATHGRYAILFVYQNGRVEILHIVDGTRDLKRLFDIRK